MSNQSAGILVYRRNGDSVEVFLVHPGGPFWAKKDTAAWSIPKGEFDSDEDPLTAAKREFREETGIQIPSGMLCPLAPIRQSSGKIVHAWMLEGSFDSQSINSNTFELEWPPKSGNFQHFPEVDRGCWFSRSDARVKLHKGLVSLIDQLDQLLELPPDASAPRSPNYEQDTLF